MARSSPGPSAFPTTLHGQVTQRSASFLPRSREIEGRRTPAITADGASAQHQRGLLRNNPSGCPRRRTGPNQFERRKLSYVVFQPGIYRLNGLRTKHKSKVLSEVTRAGKTRATAACLPRAMSLVVVRHIKAAREPSEGSRCGNNVRNGQSAVNPVVTAGQPRGCRITLIVSPSASRTNKSCHAHRGTPGPARVCICPGSPSESGFAGMRLRCAAWGT